MRNLLQKVTLVAVLALFMGTVMAQGFVKGKVVDADNNETLIGAAVIVKGTTTGASTDLSGNFTFEVPAGQQTIVVQYVGYSSQEFEVNVQEGQTTNLGTVSLNASSFGLAGLEVIADRAVERKTPVAISNVSKIEIEEKLGSRDLPMVMNNTPSVYATAQGGGAGDARINVRGFNQRNVAIMINGVPVNDMENGWVYWSNWDGVADATSSIQMQRGLSAINLATPSVGGTMNILTNPAAMDAGVSTRFETGSGSFFKTTISGHSGLINEKFAVSASVVKKTGDGVIDATWTNAWAYYLGASYNINKNHRLEAYLVGASQRHGQNLYKQNVAAYSHEFAEELGLDQGALDKFAESSQGRYYNENWNTVSTSYTGQQSFNGKTVDRMNDNMLNERENFYHKPLANLNWYAQWSDKVSQFTTLYYSGGTGGGTGTYGKIQYDYSGPSRVADWDATIAHNLDPEYTRQGIIRNSVNNQWTIGAITKFKIDFSENLKTQVGLDWRTAEIEHYREIRDLLGLASYDDSYTTNDFGSQLGLGLGDKIAYNNTNTVDWLGGFIQSEYTKDALSIYGTFGYSMIKYNYTNHFKAGDDGNELTAVTDWIGGYQLKGGANYNVSDNFSFFGNVGIVSKVPIFDAVIDDGDGTVAADHTNEGFTAFEVGTIANSSDKKLEVKTNFYYTTWSDRTLTKGVRISEDENGIAFIKGLDQRHMGFELEATYRLMDKVGFGAIASIARWEYLNDVSAVIKSYDGGITSIPINLYTADLKVGDAPQTQLAAWVNLYPVKGLHAQLIFRHNADHYADFNPANRDDATDTKQVWKTPAYSVLDAHINYNLPLKGKLGVTIFVHAFNLLDTFYVQDAVDNSAYNGYYGDNNQFSHTANSAEVFLGTPRVINAGVKITL